MLLLSTTLIGQGSIPTDDAAMNRFLEVGFFGPRTGISTLPASLQDSTVASPIYSIFGWQVDVRYKPTHNRFIGFAEAGLLMGAVESGSPRFEFWGYIGIRKPQNFGISLGPNISKYGTGLGIAPHYMFNSGNILIPVVLNIVTTNNGTRVQLITGFDRISK